MRERHLKDMKAFWKAAADGTLPAVVFVKPDGADNQHPGESTMAAGDLMAGTIVETLRHHRDPSHPPVRHEPRIQALCDALEREGRHPFPAAAGGYSPG